MIKSGIIHLVLLGDLGQLVSTHLFRDNLLGFLASQDDADTGLGSGRQVRTIMRASKGGLEGLGCTTGVLECNRFGHGTGNFVGAAVGGTQTDGSTLFSGTNSHNLHSL